MQKGRVHASLLNIHFVLPKSYDWNAASTSVSCFYSAPRMVHVHIYHTMTWKMSGLGQIHCAHLKKTFGVSWGNSCIVSQNLSGSCVI